MPVLQLTDPPGRNVIYFVFSPSPIDLNNCINLLKSEGDFSPKKIESILSVAPAGDAKWQASKVAFSSNLSGPVAFKVVLNQK